jgi:hypothetical protein
MIDHLPLIVGFIVIIGCQDRREPKNMSDGYFRLPSTIRTIDKGARLPVEDFVGARQTKIVVLVNTNCSLCLSEIWQWERLVSKYDEFRGIPIAFIIYGKTSLGNSRLLNNPHFGSFTFFRDSLSAILGANNLKADRFFNTFLLNSENRIIIPGNPNLSDQTLNNLIAYLRHAAQ